MCVFFFVFVFVRVQLCVVVLLLDWEVLEGVPAREMYRSIQNSTAKFNCSETQQILVFLHTGLPNPEDANLVTLNPSNIPA